MVHRTFDDDAQIDHDAIGPTFDLAGQTFHCLPAAPAGALNLMLEAVKTDTRGNQVFSAPDLIGFVCMVLIDERWVRDEDDPSQWRTEPADDVERFRDVCEGKKYIVPIEKLGEVVVWLTEQYVGRPTS